MLEVWKNIAVQNNNLTHSIGDLPPCRFQVGYIPSFCFSPDLAPSDSHLFPAIKRCYLGQNFQTTEELRSVVHD